MRMEWEEPDDRRTRTRARSFRDGLGGGQFGREGSGPGRKLQRVGQPGAWEALEEETFPGPLRRNSN